MKIFRNILINQTIIRNISRFIWIDLGLNQESIYNYFEKKENLFKFRALPIMSKCNPSVLLISKVELIDAVSSLVKHFGKRTLFVPYQP